MKSRHYIAVVQANTKKTLTSRLVRGIAPVVTYPATAVTNRMLSGVVTITSPIRKTLATNGLFLIGLMMVATPDNIRLVTAVAGGVVGKGMQNYAQPAFVNPVQETLQAFSIKVSCFHPYNSPAGCCMCITDCKCTVHGCCQVAFFRQISLQLLCASSW